MGATRVTDLVHGISSVSNSESSFLEHLKNHVFTAETTVETMPCCKFTDTSLE